MTQQLKYNLCAHTHTPKCNKNLKINIPIKMAVSILFAMGLLKGFNTQALLQSQGPSHVLQGSCVATHGSASGKSDPSTGTSFARLHITSHRR